MSIYLSWFIPIITVVLLMIYFRNKVRYWEALIVLLIPIMLTLIIKIIGQSSLMYSDEYWNSFGIRAEYYEAWNEKVSCRHPIYETQVYVDFEGDLCTRSVLVGYEHSFDVDNHAPNWKLRGCGGEDISISQSKFEELCERWNNKNVRELNRRFHTKDGEMYFTVYSTSFTTIEPITTIHRYKNKVKHTNYKFRKVDPKLKVYDYNSVNGYTCDYIYGSNDLKNQLLLRQWNAFLGARKKVVMMLIPYYNKERVVAINQEAYWKGGNKNEFILCVGVNGGDIEWVHAITWTPEVELRDEIVKGVLEMKKYNSEDIINYMGNKINSHSNVIRRDFEEFNYLTVPVPTWAIILVYILAILSSLGLAYWSIVNEYTTEE